MTDLLFAECVIPACTRIVTEPGETCADCVRCFGDFLQATGRERLTEEQIRERDDYTYRAYLGMWRYESGVAR